MKTISKTQFKIRQRKVRIIGGPPADMSDDDLRRMAALIKSRLRHAKKAA
jgi:hypothetical protein